ncbi:sugar transferase [Constantimarinum furrinae]|uniref:Sugar transferase n=1 Tax=Constantimarinum furrinae TaxID=2562285 RepID=A0A7G8PQV8_9FLAO|nr:sugar transferase [Constantimarinum furrinae]QNJ96724.1 Sugar transferase [Constantimarinum furrinae]
MLSKDQKVVKRVFDLIVSVVLLPLLFLFIVLLILIITISTGSFGLYRQKRIGQFGKPFTLYKLKTLKGRKHHDAKEIKENETRIGGWLRKSKLDELPQIFNILKGEMSWVGPRPDIPGYADALEGDDRVILQLKPGLTGPATLKYKNEEQLLLRQKDPLQYNDEVIWPDKVAINKEYINNWSLLKDIKYIIASVFT